MKLSHELPILVKGPSGCLEIFQTCNLPWVYSSRLEKLTCAGHAEQTTTRSRAAEYLENSLSIRLIARGFGGVI